MLVRVVAVGAGITNELARGGVLGGSVPRVLCNRCQDHQVTDGLRFVQLTPPGSACSIMLGTGVTEMSPGSQQGLQIVVDDVEAARQELIGRGVPASEVDVQPWGFCHLQRSGRQHLDAAAAARP